MKIRITESQMKMLQESLPVLDDPIGHLHRYTINTEPILVKIFNELTNLTLAHILNNEYNFKKSEDIILKLEHEIKILETIARNFIETKTDDENYELEGRFDDARIEFNDKLSIINDLTYKLIQLKEFCLEENVMSHFELLDITDLQ